MSYRAFADPSSGYVTGTGEGGYARQGTIHRPKNLVWAKPKDTSLEGLLKSKQGKRILKEMGLGGDFDDVKKQKLDRLVAGVLAFRLGMAALAAEFDPEVTEAITKFLEESDGGSVVSVVDGKGLLEGIANHPFGPADWKRAATLQVLKGMGSSGTVPDFFSPEENARSIGAIRAKAERFFKQFIDLGITEQPYSMPDVLVSAVGDALTDTSDFGGYFSYSREKQFPLGMSGGFPVTFFPENSVFVTPSASQLEVFIAESGYDAEVSKGPTWVDCYILSDSAQPDIKLAFDKNKYDYSTPSPSNSVEFPITVKMEKVFNGILIKMTSVAAGRAVRLTARRLTKQAVNRLGKAVAVPQDEDEVQFYIATTGRISSIVNELEEIKMKIESEPRLEHFVMNVLFDTDKADFKGEGADHKGSIDDGTLADLLWLTEWLSKNNSAKISIEGHTDGDGTREHNQELSEKRANRVKEYLVEKGIDPGRLSIKGFGEDVPLKPEQGVLAGDELDRIKASNRRVEIVVLE